MTIYTSAAEVWDAIAQATNVTEIRSILGDANVSNVTLEANDLKTLALSQSAAAEGDAGYLLLYSGQLNSVDMQTYAISKAASDPGAAIIDNTDAGILVDSGEFRDSVLRSVGIAPEARDAFLYGAEENGAFVKGLWHDVSQNFVTENSGLPIEVYSVGSSDTSVLKLTELPESLVAGNHPTINGLATDDLYALYQSEGIEGVFNKVMQVSFADFAQDTFDGQAGIDLLKGDPQEFNVLLQQISDSDVLTAQELEDLGASGRLLDAIKTNEAVKDAFAAGDTEGGADLLRDFVARSAPGSAEASEGFDAFATMMEGGAIAEDAGVLTTLAVGIMRLQDLPNQIWDGIQDLLKSMGLIDPDNEDTQGLLENVNDCRSIANVIAAELQQLDPSDLLEDVLGLYQQALAVLSQGHDPLARDLNGDGHITSMSEVFGTSTTARDCFLALRADKDNIQLAILAA